MNRKIPRTMSTQHPDNVRMPFFIENSVIGGEDEIKEAFYVFDHLKCEEQLWDAEGKEVDNHVVKKLLHAYPEFFTENKLGQDVFLTLRVPNPRVEQNEAKILLETLESLPRNSDIAKAFYGKTQIPVFEVCLPMTQTAQEARHIEDYYKKFVGGKETQKLSEGTLVGDWIGEFKPDTIQVIPLIEEKEALLNAGKIVGELVKGKKTDHQRVWLAFSDPAENYGLISTALLNKIALQELDEVEEKTSVQIYPIAGMGGAPFRGNLLPGKEQDCMNEFSSVQTFTIQSAFKYDANEKEVRESIENINTGKKKKAKIIEQTQALAIIEKYSEEYQKQVEGLADLINKTAEFVPSRRKRKLHTGLFGYSRKVGKQKLPRAIKFCAALYSIGIPPEFLGLNALNEKEMDWILDHYPKLKLDLEEAGKYLNEIHFKKEVRAGNEILEKLKEFKINPNTEHQKLTQQIYEKIAKNQTHELHDLIVKAGWQRKFLG
ncbi:MAG: phosphoenolpyruvate carboxylase [Candidatus Diapherotrites archaeon]|nr:phosphoenolpyruvate carboxylase [Candidatus Diapherotrites archaeon]